MTGQPIMSPDVDRHDGWRQTWVPVERRFLGIDKRTLLPAGIVALLAAVALWLVPGINAAIPVHNVIRAGDVIQVGTRVQFTPVPGANLVDGLRQGTTRPDSYPDRAVLTYSGVTFSVLAQEYRGTPEELLAQIRRTNSGYRGNGGLKVSGDPVTIVNVEGDRGAAADFTGTNARGLVAAFVFGGTGVEVTALSADNPDDSAAPAVAAMIQSVRPVAGGGS